MTWTPKKVMAVAVAAAVVLTIWLLTAGTGDPSQAIADPAGTSAVDKPSGAGGTPASGDPGDEGALVAYPIELGTLAEAAAVAEDYVETVNTFDPDETAEAHSSRLAPLISRVPLFDTTSLVPTGAARDMLASEGPRTAVAKVRPTAVMVTPDQVSVIVDLTVSGAGEPTTSSVLVTVLLEGGFWRVYESSPAV